MRELRAESIEVEAALKAAKKKSKESRTSAAADEDASAPDRAPTAALTTRPRNIAFNSPESPIRSSSSDANLPYEEDGEEEEDPTLMKRLVDRYFEAQKADPDLTLAAYLKENYPMSESTKASLERDGVFDVPKPRSKSSRKQLKVARQAKEL